MGKLTRGLIISLCIFVVGLTLTFMHLSPTTLDASQEASFLAQNDQKTVYVVPVHGTIERGLSAFMTRAFRDAAEEGADMILLDINTPGGTLEAAFEIKDIIVNEDLPVYAFVSGRAISAGAFLALASDQLYYHPDSTIGAAEARMGEEIADEKVMSVWEAEMRGVAELRDRDEELAAAMVRREMEIEGLVASGELLTLRAGQAVENNMGDGLARNYEELLEKTGFEGAQLIEYPIAWAERLARFLTSPMVASILLTLGMTGLIIEISSAGFGIAGSISLLSFGLFFGGHIFAGLAGYEVLLFFLLGVVLLLAEAFIAGFGVLGVAGIISSAFAIVLSADNTQEGINILVLSFIASLIILVIAFRFFVKSRFFDKIVLRHTEAKDQGYIGTNVTYRDLEGKTGMTKSPLRPAGTADIGGSRVDVVSEGGYIPKEQEVKVVKVEGSRIIVKEINSEDQNAE